MDIQLYLEALARLRPDQNFSIIEGVVIWDDKNVTTPTEEEVLSTINLINYKELRAAEYPPITEYLDGVVKGDQDQINKYIADCLAVKAKYPKGAS
jgi:hypothetical protein